jgi:hypothetical protein
VKEGSAGGALSPRRAFVVQFSDEADLEKQRHVGRVEHVVSGQAARFQTLQELLAFIAQMLGESRDAPPAGRGC